MAPLLQFGVSACDTSAARQQLALIEAVYADDRPHAEQLLGTDGRVIVWVHQEQTWPPSWALIESGPGRYFLILEGTTTIKQGVGHLQGTWGRQYGDGAVLVNGAWLEAWEAIREEVLAALPSDLAGSEFFLSGHSYGGALAHLAGREMAARIGESNVQVLTFGEPKALTGGYVGPTPQSHWRIVSPLDPVQAVPSGDVVPALTQFVLPLVWRRNYADWTHYGEQVTLWGDGAVNEPEPLPDPAEPGVSDSVLGSHTIANYLGRLKRNYERFGGDLTSPLALRITREMLDGDPVQEEAKQLPSVLTAPEGFTVSVPSVFDPFIFVERDIKGEDAMPFKVNLFFESGKYGWSETYYYVNGIKSAMGDAVDAAFALADERVAVFAPELDSVLQYSLSYIRVSDDQVRRDGFLDQYAKQGVAKTANKANPKAKMEPVWTCIVSRLYASNKTWRNLYFRPLPDIAMKATDGVDLVQPDKSLRIQKYLDYLVNKGWCIKAIDRTDTNPEKPITGFTVGVGDNLGEVVVACANHGVTSSGQAVFITGGGGELNKVQKPVRGRFIVQKVVDNNNLVIFPKSDVTKALPGGATLLRQVYTYQPIVRCSVGKVTHRDTGRPFDVSHGRRPTQK